MESDTTSYDATPAAGTPEQPDPNQMLLSFAPDPFEDDTPLSCGLDTPDYCESCQ